MPLDHAAALLLLHELFLHDHLLLHVGHGQLLHNLVVAIHRVAHGSYELRGTSWEKPMWMEHGEACTLTFELAIPITTEFEPLVIVNETAVEHDSTSASDRVRA